MALPNGLWGSSRPLALSFDQGALDAFDYRPAFTGANGCTQ